MPKGGKVPIMSMDISRQKQPVSVQFRHMPKSEAIESLVWQEAVALQRLSAPGAHSEVVIDETQRRNFGGVFEVRVRYTVPGDRVYAAQGSEQSGSHEYLYGAVRDAFDQIRHQLQKARKKRTRHPSVPDAA
jgi:ribosome-associated translation inhibitor RaiA